ncbi:hypothetical protein NA56DRAFT_578041 [Hyaloscypha hepaticicola]|uniref:Uncharacterized protein n=1 Tax=Hyaloscypha hepaticicola TaxID=2082293 RepID=A0A2J6PUZ2_9HELO|nr:hypothetical protein NA56DRAFT_578041 [Hyaloscypha hepaticicola]
MSLRIALVLILVPAVTASSRGDAFSNNLFSGISPLLVLFGQDFANHFLSQSTSWLDSIIFATGPLGIPAAITGAIRVGGYSFLKSLIGRARERESTIEKDLLSSTSVDVCEL